VTGIRIHLFGKFQVLVNGQAFSGFESRKVRELFCYLLLYRGRPHPREVLADLLWNESETNQPNQCLRKTLWKLRTALDSQGAPLSDYLLLVEPDLVQFNTQAALWLDVESFEQAFNQVKNLTGNELDPQSAASLKEAVNLYQGGLQESWYQDWYLLERERFLYEYLSILDRLMEYCEARCEYAAGILYGNIVLGFARARERTHRQLMRLHHLAQDRTAALNQYERCVQVLQEELGVKPSRRTEMLHQQIISDEVLERKPTGDPGTRQPASPTRDLPDLIGRLKTIQTALGDLQQQVDQEIEAMEQIISHK
jgi:DNA-binding SARP family transcriptional activator